MEEKKEMNSKLIGSSVFFILFLAIGIKDLLIKKAGCSSLIWFAISLISLLYFVYHYKRLKNNPGEMYDDERVKFIGQKASSISFRVLFTVIVALKLFIDKAHIVIDASLLLTVLLGIALVTELTAYLICKAKY